MCTIAYFNFDHVKVLKYLSLIAETARKRGRDSFGIATFPISTKDALISRGKCINKLLLDIIPMLGEYNYHIRHLLVHSRAVPESEPDYLNPSITTQPFKLNTENLDCHIYCAFHGLINNVHDLCREYKINLDPDKVVDTVVLREILSKTIHYNDIYESLLNLSEDLQGSYTIFVFYELGYDSRLYVLSNFLPVFYTKLEISNNTFCVSTVPINDNSIVLEPYSLYEFKIWTNELKISHTSLPFINNNGDIAVVYSGGLDSTTVATLYKVLYPNRRLYLINFDYGQDAKNWELEAATKVASWLDAEVLHLNVKGIFEILDNGSLLLSKNAYDKTVDTITDMERDVHYVSMRNLILSSLCGALCEKHNITTLAYGGNLTEGMVYPDNGNRFFYCLKEVFKTSGKNGYMLNFRAPLLNLLKKEIVKLGIAMQITPYHLSVSCYHPYDKDGNWIACGECGSCINRARAFEINSYKDPIEYCDNLSNYVSSNYFNLPKFNPKLLSNVNLEDIRNNIMSLINKYCVEV